MRSLRTWAPAAPLLLYLAAFLVQPSLYAVKLSFTDTLTGSFPTLANFRLLEQVVPKRRLAGPSELAETDVVAQERLFAYEPRHCFTGRQPGSDASLQISHRKRLEVLIVELPGDVHGQLEKRLGQAPVDGA